LWGWRQTSFWVHQIHTPAKDRPIWSSVGRL